MAPPAVCSSPGRSRRSTSRRFTAHCVWCAVCFGWCWRRPRLQFVPKIEKIYQLTLKFETYEKYKEILAIAGRSALRHVCSAYTAQDFQNKRGAVSTSMLKQVYPNG